MTYDWAYLCSDPARLNLTLRFLPRDKPFEGLKMFYICWASHLDGNKRRAELEHEVRNYAPSWLRYGFIDLTELEDQCPLSLRTYFRNDKPRWALGMKLLLPLAFSGPYLYTDDDVIVPRDPYDLMGNSFGSKGCFRFEGKKLDVVQQLFQAFQFKVVDPALDAIAYDGAALDAGVWFHRHRDNWPDQLWRFADMPYLRGLTTKNLEFRCLDQRFLTMFGLKHGWDQLTIHNGFAPPKFIRPKYFDKVQFFHYKSQSKYQWMALLHEYLGV